MYVVKNGYVILQFEHDAEDFEKNFSGVYNGVIDEISNLEYGSDKEEFEKTKKELVAKLLDLQYRVING